MNKFSVHIPTKIFMGDHNIPEFYAAIKLKSSHVLLVTGGGSVKKNGYFDEIVSCLSIAGIKYTEFSGIEPNPLSTTINKAAEVNKDKGIDGVLAFGGGSVMDAAKAISALLYMYNSGINDQLDIWDYVLGSKKNGLIPGALPIYAIPTTAATASEVTPFAVISDLETRGKAPLAYEFFKPSASLLVPRFTTLLPDTVTRDGASDILSHVFENYLLGGCDATFTDRYCESVIKTVIETLPRVLEDPLNIKHRAELLWCSTVALNGMHLVGRRPAPFILHAIEHAMSAVKHELAHGRGLATLFPAYFRWLWNKERARDRLNRLGQEIFNLNPKDGLIGLHFIAAFEDWLKENKLLQSVSSLGFSEEDKNYVADYVIRVNGGGKDLDALGPFGKSDILDILNLTETQKA